MSRKPWGAGVGLLLLWGCGASVSKTYESDVRFERCYALDWKADVDSGIRQRCWEEWVTFYAEGQTRDRIEYAKRQMRSISLGLEPSSSAVAAVVRPAAPLPEPTSVFAPVPMMAVTGSSSAAPATSSATPSAGPRSACQTRCDKTLEGCLSGCASLVCEQYCAQKHARCDQRCGVGESKKP